MIWALELGETTDAHAAVSSYAAVEADIGGPFPPGLLDDLEGLAERYPGFQPRDASGWHTARRGRTALLRGWEEHPGAT